MAFSLTWLAEVLEDAGLKISPVDDWQIRGRGDVRDVFGVICHHTGSSNPRRLNIPTLRSLQEGRKASATLAALPGPLAQLGLARDGTYFIIAAGRAIHAGAGSFRGVSGNSRFIGIEAENEGTVEDFPWPAVQLDAYHRGVAAILKRLGKDASFCCGHKEYAPRRKPDPSLDMENFRQSVQAILDGTGPPVPLIPPVEPHSTAGQQPRPTLRRPTSGELVKLVQRKVGVITNGQFGPKTEAAVRRFQRNHSLVPDGIVGPETWQALDTFEPR